MGLSEQAKGFINNVVAGAVWDGIKQLWAPVVLAAMVAVWEKIKHGSLDWVAIVGMFLFASLLAFLNFRKPKQLQGGKPQQWKPAWQRLQWANAERERLEREIQQLKAAQPKPLAGRIFELAARYRKAAREFHKQNPQPPAPPASTAWATKANGWYRTNFYSEIQRAQNELAAEGLSDVAFDVSIEYPPTLDRIEQIAQKLRFLASQLSDDPSERSAYPSADIDKDVTTPINISIVSEHVEYAGGADCPLKLRLHLRNESAEAIDVRFQDFRPQFITTKKVVTETFQVWLAGAFLPPQPHGIGRVAVIPEQQFATWLAIDEGRFNKAQVEEHRGKIGILVLLVNGQHYDIQL
jgi:hypothetical protein